MTRIKLSRWLSVLTLAVALAPSTASVLEADTLSIGGTFHMDQLTGTVGADLAEVFAHHNENTWSLTLYGITQSFEEIDYGDSQNHEDIENFITHVHATSFEFRFVGPDADVLNEVISQQLTKSSLGDDTFLELSNLYSYGGFWPGNSFWDIGLLPLDDAAGVSFFAGGSKAFSAYPQYASGGAWFSAEGGHEGYPLVESQRIISGRTSINDSRPESSGSLVSIEDFVDIEAPILSLPGDFNGNGTVDNADLTLLLNHWGSAVTPVPAGWIGGLLTGPAVDNDELTALLNHWGAAPAGIGASGGPQSRGAVPEPATVVLFGLSLVGLSVASRRCVQRNPVTVGIY